MIYIYIYIYKVSPNPNPLAPPPPPPPRSTRILETVYTKNISTTRRAKCKNAGQISFCPPNFFPPVQLCMSFRVAILHLAKCNHYNIISEGVLVA